MTTTSPNQEGVEGTECEEVWMITGESVILFTYASFVRNPFVLPHQEGIFLGWFARDYTSLRNSWEKGPSPCKMIIKKGPTPQLYSQADRTYHNDKELGSSSLPSSFFQRRTTALLSSVDILL